MGQSRWPGWWWADPPDDKWKSIVTGWFLLLIKEIPLKSTQFPDNMFTFCQDYKGKRRIRTAARFQLHFYNICIGPTPDLISHPSPSTPSPIHQEMLQFPSPGHNLYLFPEFNYLMSHVKSQFCFRRLSYLDFTLNILL